MVAYIPPTAKLMSGFYAPFYKVMIVYHVTSLKKLNRYLKTGYIIPPVRAWENIEQAERMSISISGFAFVGDLEHESFKLPHKPDRSTNVQLTTIAPIAQNTCYGLPFQDNALGGLCKTHN